MDSGSIGRGGASSARVVTSHSMSTYRSQHLTTVLITAVVCTVFITGNYLHAQWSNPAGQPPMDNIAAPINTSNSSQFKAAGGEIGADRLTARTQVQSNQYCNESGTECYAFSDLGGTGGGSGGGGGVTCADNEFLVGGNHTCGECRELGGMVENDRSGNIMCRFYTADSQWCDNYSLWSGCTDGGVCPKGWNQYEQWSTTVSRTCNKNDYCGPCTTGSHPWSNRGPETCTFIRASGDDNCIFNRGTCTASTYEVGCY